MEPTQVAEKPVDQGSGSASGSGGGSASPPVKRGRVCDLSPTRSPSPPVKRGSWYQQLPAHLRDLGDDDESDSDVEVVEKPGGNIKCLVCGRRGRHYPSYCPYLRFLPHEATLPPGISRFCKCCFLKDGHPDRKDWKGVAVIMECDNCGTFFKHWTEECPDKDSDDRN